MDQPVQRQQSLLTSCLACLCCWSCWREILWALCLQDYGRYEPRRHETGQHATGQSRRGPDERRRLLDSPPKGHTNRGRQQEGLEDPKVLMRKSGVPPFPRPQKGTEQSADKKKESFSDFNEVCPTCLDLYTPDNPEIVTKCGHRFHLGCLYEWLERANTCPICYSPLDFEEIE